MDKKLRPSIFKRSLALLIDMVALGIVGYISGLFLEDFYVSLGSYGTLVGSTVTILYFSVLQSKIGKGQSMGKMVIGAKVTDLHGQYLTFEKSLLRSFILFFPIMNVEIFSSGDGMIVVVMLLVLSFFASLYFILVNKSRRCLHDLLVPSIVTNQDVSEIQVDELNDRSLKKIIPIAAIGAVMIGMGLYTTFTENRLHELLEVKKRIEDKEGVIIVNEVKSGRTTYSRPNEPSETYTFVSITVRVSNKEEASTNSSLFKECYDIIRKEIPEAEKVDRVTISLYYGYNIGIASSTRKVTKTFER
ncbi:MAG TPA: RDD family protein [Cyclobacteriaceae bacterium]|jgi:uncharacterized RDD family membrane protein YckC|nr:RDD family protein [Cyclobacteriaceae bacterium]